MFRVSRALLSFFTTFQNPGFFKKPGFFSAGH